jgi:hypothetical protein
MSATEWPELLEIAAAYLPCVNVQDHFSRPQLMRQVHDRTLSVKTVHSFAQLLRYGKIAKN